MAQGSSPRSEGPVSVADLAKEAENFDFYVQQPLITWLRSAKILRAQASTCERQGDLKLAFLYAYRHLVLILNKITEYPADERRKHKELIKQEKDRVAENLTKLESWKPKLQAQYDREVRALEARRRVNVQHTVKTRDEFTFDGLEPDSLHIHDHRDIAVELARQELLRRDIDASNGISAMLQQTHKLVDRNSSSSQAHIRSESHELYHYPEVISRDASIVQPSSTPWPSSLPATAPTPPSKVSYETPERPTQGPIVGSQVKFKATATTEGGAPLRPVVLPSKLQQTFLNLADANTARDLETCGVLCASLVSNALMITHLIIPDQTSTSDTCDTTDAGDIALYEYCEEQNLISCGWIHTHPSQTCFLSSRDLHTSAAYQQMLPEAIAIVCAPRHNPSIGIFRLTSPPGLPAVLNCQVPGLFHQHEERNLYTDATSPGHVIEDDKLVFKVMDLRSR